MALVFIQKTISEEEFKSFITNEINTKNDIYYHWNILLSFLRHHSVESDYIEPIKNKIHYFTILRDSLENECIIKCKRGNNIENTRYLGCDYFEVCRDYEVTSNQIAQLKNTLKWIELKSADPKLNMSDEYR